MRNDLTHCIACGKRLDACDCGGEGRDAQARVEQEWEDQKKDK